MPNTAVFLPAMSFAPFEECKSECLDCRSRFLLSAGHLKLGLNLLWTARHFRGFLLNCRFFFFALDGPLQCHRASLRHDLYVVRVGGQGLVLDNRVPYLPRQLAVRLVFLLLIGRVRGVTVPLIYFCVVGCCGLAALLCSCILRP